MNARHRISKHLVWPLLLVVFASLGQAEILYVDGRTGHDANPGTQAAPLKTFERAADLVNESNAPGPATVIIAPGVYSLRRSVRFANDRDFTETDRLAIRASILPDEPNWMPGLMPVIASMEDPRQPGRPGRVTETVNIKIALSHVTIQGLKFLGNSTPNNMHACVERIGKGLDDLLITQCVFAGDKHGANIYAATLATGDRFVVDHCVFSGCHGCTVYWDGLDEIGGKGCAMRYCIVKGALISGVWTCQTAEDFEFHHNVIADSEYIWMRKPGDRQRYRLNACALIGNQYVSGYGTASGPSGQTGPEVTFDKNNVITEGRLVWASEAKTHLTEGSAGCDLGAGLFTDTSRPRAGAGMVLSN